MTNPRLEIGKSTAVLLFIIQNLRLPTIRKVFKILYFAEQKKLAACGHKILSNDRYVKMELGPVPSKLYDRLKEARGEKPRLPEWKPFYDAIEVKEGFHLSANGKANLDFLSKWDIDFLTLSLEENKEMNAAQLSNKSHDSAWNSVQMGGEIDILKMAKAGGAGDEMLEYIEEDEALNKALQA